MDKIQELSLEQLHYDIADLSNAVKTYMALNVEKPVKEVKLPAEVRILNPSKDFDGKVTVENEVTAKFSNIDELATRLDTIVKTIEANKLDAVVIKDPVVVKDLANLEKLLKQLLDKDTSVNVTAPNVKVSTPNSVKISNWPSNPKEPIAVRLSDGQRFIEQLTRIVGGGGGSSVQSSLIAGDAIKVVNPDGTNISAGGGGGGTFTLSNANDIYGEALSVADGSTVDVVSIPSSAAGYKVAGMSCTGTGDGHFYVTIGGSKVLSGRINATQPSIYIALPNPITISLGTTVSLKVINKSGSTADFEATLLGV